MVSPADERSGAGVALPDRVGCGRGVDQQVIAWEGDSSSAFGEIGVVDGGGIRVLAKGDPGTFAGTVPQRRRGILDAAGGA